MLGSLEGGSGGKCSNCVVVGVCALTCLLTIILQVYYPILMQVVDCEEFCQKSAHFHLLAGEVRPYSLPRQHVITPREGLAGC